MSKGFPLLSGLGYSASKINVPEKIKHIAVMRLSAMGDVAMTVPVLQAFSQQFPDVKLTVISRPFFKPLFSGVPNVDFFAFDDKKHNGFLGLVRLYSDLKPLKIDAFADLHNVLRSKVIRTLFALSGKKTAFTEKARSEKKALTRSKNKIFKPLPPIFERHLETFDNLEFHVRMEKLQFPEKQTLDSEVLKIVGDKTQNWIGIAPFAQYDSKVYPADLMQKVIDKLSSDPNNKIFLFGGKLDIANLENFAKQKINVVNIAGKLPFHHELQLISNLDVMLSMDSGNAHIAAMFGVKTITLWGATHPFSGFAPFRQPFKNAITSDRNQFPKLPTSVYGNKKVEGYENAMRTISPEEVVAKIIRNIENLSV